MPVSGSTSVAAQRTIRLTTFSRADGPIAISVLSRSNSCQAGQPSTWRLPRKRSGWTGAPTASSSAATDARLMIEITFRATSEKLWPSARSTLGGPRNSSAQYSAKNRSMAARPSGGAQVAARGLAVLGADRQRVACLVESRSQLREAGVPHQHQELLLGQIGGVGRVEAGGAVLDGVHPVERHGLAGPKAIVRGSGSGDSPLTG